MLLQARKKCVESKGNNGSNIGGVESALCGMPSVMSANVGAVKRVAGGFGVDCKGVCRLLGLSFVNQGVDCVNQAVLGTELKKPTRSCVWHVG